MYKVSEISIDGFWQKYKINCKFKQDVNIVIGRNGTGKTTFMNLLFAVLSADIDSLYEHDFKEISVVLVAGNKKKTIKAKKIDAQPFQIVDYYISQKKFTLSLVGGAELRNLPTSYRRRALEQASVIKQVLAEFISLASLSVYRITNDSEVMNRENTKRNLRSPVDQRLDELMVRLTQFQLELSSEALKISTKLQGDVLKSLLYENDTKSGRYRIETNYDETSERASLIDAYKQLGVVDNDIQKRIQNHTAAIKTTYNEIKEKKDGLNLSALEARKRTQKVIDMSLVAKKETQELYSQITLFIEILEKFIIDKKFEIKNGELKVNAASDVTISRLSSGEKQLLILFIEALLQKQKPYIFLADEPELSLHIAWQRQIISAIRDLNPKAQIIVATHSPEVAGPFRKDIINMADIRHE